MSEYSHFVAWDARCRDCGSYGMTSGDSRYLGLTDYNQPYPCPNGLPIDLRQPGNCEHWRRRVDKAKRDIEVHREQCAWQELGEQSVVVFAADDVAGIIELVKGAFDDQ
jgi:hypothetical protein